MYKFEKLEVWNESVVLLKDIYRYINRLPSNERHNLCDQIRRSMTSVCLNIAEGSGSENDLEYKRFLNIAKKSLFETIAAIKITECLYTISGNEILKDLDMIGAKLGGLIKYLNNQPKAK